MGTENTTLLLCFCELGGQGRVKFTMVLESSMPRLLYSVFSLTGVFLLKVFCSFSQTWSRYPPIAAGNFQVLISHFLVFRANAACLKARDKQDRISLDLGNVS